MEGAFLIWDDLLRDLSMRLSGFMRVLVTCLLESIAKPATIEPRTDIEKEALAMWLLHTLDSETDKREGQASLVTDVIKWCCLYPGYWTRRIGREVLDRGDSGLQADWQDLFNASSIELEADYLETGVLDEDTALPDSHVRVEELMDGDKIRFEREEGDLSGRWRRPVISFTTPLGVVK